MKLRGGGRLAVQYHYLGLFVKHISPRTAPEAFVRRCRDRKQISRDEREPQQRARQATGHKAM